ncbi:MAG: thioredoxin-dependent thiol peroxidase [Gemmatimonadota bacterium]
MVEVGDAAPEFELQTDAGETIRLADLRGRRVVLFVYPKDDTSGCTKEACGFRDLGAEYERAGIVVLGMSPDGVDSHARFRDKYDLSFPLLADPDHRTAEAYGTWGPKKLYGREYEGIHRTTFVIDPDGRIERVYRKVKPDGHAAAVLEDLAR